MSDLIDRQAVLNATSTTLKITGKENAETVYAYIKKLCDDIKALPPAQPKIGRWIKLDMHRGMADHKCTACEQECYVPTCMGEPMYAFCPNCGADMREGEQDD